MKGWSTDQPTSSMIGFFLSMLIDFWWIFLFQHIFVGQQKSQQHRKTPQKKHLRPPQKTELSWFLCQFLKFWQPNSTTQKKTWTISSSGPRTPCTMVSSVLPRWGLAKNLETRDLWNTSWWFRNSANQLIWFDMCQGYKVPIILKFAFLLGGWTTHLKNMLVKLDHFPRDRGKNKKCLKPPPRILLLVQKSC